MFRRRVVSLIMLILALSLLPACSFAGRPGYYYVDRFYVEGEGDELRAGVEEMTREMYSWYSSIEGEKGVYILHSSHYSRELMKAWRDSGYNGYAPDMDLWYFAVSPNYLEDTGLELSDELISDIEDGVRLYLIPDRYSAAEAEELRSFLTANALYGLDEDTLIDTVFRKERVIRFESYSFDGALESLTDGDIRDPLIYVVSPENMRYFEAESLIATGAEDSYIKLTEDAYKNHVEEGFPEGLREKKVTFRKG